MKAITYKNAINHWKNGYLAWNPKKYDYYKKNFYIGLSYLEINPTYPYFAPVSGIAYAFYDDIDQEIEDRSIIYIPPEYIKIYSKETIDNITKSDYIDIIQDFEHKIKQSMIKNKIDALSKDFSND